MNLDCLLHQVMNKVPGLKFQLQQMRMDLVYASKFDEKSNWMPGAYERLLLEAFAADHSHFVSAKELDASWRIFTPVLRELAAKGIKPQPYPYGSRGPPATDALAAKYGMAKFGGGMTTYVLGGAVKPSPNDVEAFAPTTSNSASSALRNAATASLVSAASGESDKVSDTASVLSTGRGADLAAFGEGSLMHGDGASPVRRPNMHGDGAFPERPGGSPVVPESHPDARSPAPDQLARPVPMGFASAALIEEFVASNLLSPPTSPDGPGLATSP
jgi:hypothetical protein